MNTVRVENHEAANFEGLEILLERCPFVLIEIKSWRSITECWHSNLFPSVCVPGRATQFGSNLGSIVLYLFPFLILR